MSLFSEIRQLLLHPPSSSSWLRLTRLFERDYPPKEVEAALEYAAEHLKTWPADICFCFFQRTLPRKKPVYLPLVKKIRFQHIEMKTLPQPWVEWLAGSRVEVLSFVSCGLVSMQGLVLAPSLRHLDFFSCNHLEDSQDLSICFNLEQLGFDTCRRLGSLPNLHKLKNLKKLSLKKTFQREMEEDIMKAVSLEELSLGECEHLVSVLFLKELPLLSRLDLSFCRAFRDFSSITKLSKLQELNLTYLSNISSFQGFEALHELTLLEARENHFLTDISGIMSLQKLTHLNLEHCFSLDIVPPIGMLGSRREVETYQESLRSYYL